MTFRGDLNVTKRAVHPGNSWVLVVTSLAKGGVESTPPSNSRTGPYFFHAFFAFSSLPKVLLGDIRFSSVAQIN